MSRTPETPSRAIWSPDYPIVTDRLRLRPHRPGDLEDLLVYHSDPEVTRYIPWPVRTLEQTREALAMRLHQGTVHAVGEWLVLAMEEAASGTVIGEVLLKYSDDRNRVGEVGYAMRRDRQGKGLASEAVRAMLDLGFRSFGLTRITAAVEAPNAASRRLLERFGFTRDETLDEGELLGYALSAETWQPPRSASTEQRS